MHGYNSLPHKCILYKYIQALAPFIVESGNKIAFLKL